MAGDAQIESPFRTPSPWEAAIFARIAEADFPGRDVIAAQLRTCLVRTIDGDGSLAILPTYLAPAATVKRVPAEAEAERTDGVTVHAELHVLEGVAAELDLYSEDGSPLGPRPEPAAWRVIVLPPSPSGDSLDRARSADRRRGRSR